MFTRMTLCLVFVVGGFTVSSVAVALPEKGVKKTDPAKANAAPVKAEKTTAVKKDGAKATDGAAQNAHPKDNCPGTCNSGAGGGYCFCCTGDNDCDKCPSGTEKVLQGGGQFYCRTALPSVSETGGGAPTTLAE